MYSFVRGPLMWITSLVFAAGMIYRIVTLVSLSRKKDQVIYNHMNLGWAGASIGHWILPFNHTVRQYPGYSLVAYLFHMILLFVPVFLLAHNVLFYESWNISLWTLPEQFADILTLIILGAIVFMALRRLLVDHVRIVTTASDYLLLVVVALPFVSGFIAYHQLFQYKWMMILHILSGQLMLVLIPFTKLSHALLFFFSRAHIGMEFGQRRGTRTW